MFTPDFMGNAHGDAGKPWLAAGFYGGAPPYRDDSGNSFDPPRMITRYLSVSAGLINPADDANLLNAANFVDFDNLMEGPGGLHNQAHTCIGGTLGNPHTSFRDPFVFLLHSNVDRLFAKWQLQRNLNRLDPKRVYGGYSNTQGSSDVNSLRPNWGILSPLEPWAGADAQTPATGIIANVYPARPWAYPENQIVYKDSKDPSVVNPPSYDAPPWPPGITINNADSTPQALAACVFQNQLSLFWKANDPSNNISYSVGPSHAGPETAWWTAGFGRLQSLGNDRIDWVLRVGATDPATVLFVLEAVLGITWKKVLNVPDGQGSSWNIFTQDAKRSDAVSLWSQQVNNGQSLTFSKAGFLGFMKEVGTLDSLGGLPAGSSLTFRWVQD